jgi:hypothetical protein
MIVTKEVTAMTIPVKEIKADAFLNTRHNLTVNTVAMMVNKHPRTIRYWYDNNPDLFQAALDYTKKYPKVLKAKYAEALKEAEV